MTKNDFASAKSISFDKIPIIDISEIYTKNGFEKLQMNWFKQLDQLDSFILKGMVFH